MAFKSVWLYMHSSTHLLTSFSLDFYVIFFSTFEDYLRNCNCR